MKREEVIQAVQKKMEELGIPQHVASVRKVPSSVECQILLGGADVLNIKARSGITHSELKTLLDELEDRWHLKHDITGSQVDLEEAIAEREMA